MSKEFMREERYIVFKMSDVERYLTDKDRANITMMKMEIDAGRDCANKPPFKGLIVEADWPEYEPTWKAIEARVTGAQPAPNAVAYLDLGVGGYMDIGTDLTDEELDAIPKGRHMLGIVGTYGIDGYVPAQPAPSVPEGWLRAIDEALVAAHIGVANAHDTYEQAKAKLDNLIGFHVDVSTDPAVNGGWKLVPIVSTHEMKEAGACAGAVYYAIAKDVWSAMLAAAPEAKP